MKRQFVRKIIANFLTLCAAASLALSAAVAGAQGSASEAADWLFVGKHIITMVGDEPEKNRKDQALAVTGDRISWIGAAADAEAITGPETRVVELGRQALLPGFIDAHGHITFQSVTLDLANVASPPVGPVTDIDSLVTTLQDYIAERKPEAEAWVIGNGYDDSLLKESRHPTRTDLDRVSTEHPLALMHVSGHLAAANSKALALVGINADSSDPDGGHIRRFPGGTEPNGVLEETATYPLRGYMLGG
ncbi:MAG: amidohydrolase family protein, partial [Pseudomonadales bacterium]